MPIVNLALSSTTQSTVATAISTAISSMVSSITTHPAWTAVNTVTNLGTSATNWTTLKCAASVSGLANDFYVTFYQNGTTVQVFIAETFIATGVSEQWTLTVTGSPTGGTFTVNGSGGTSANTGTIAPTATAATVQSTFQTAFGAGSVAVTGGTGGPWLVSFQGNLASTPITLAMQTNSLTGGTSPSVTFTHTTVGNYTVQHTYTPFGSGSTQVAVDATGRISGALGANPTTGAVTSYGALANYQSTSAGYASYSTNTQALTTTTIWYAVTTYNDHICFAMASTNTTLHWWYYGAVTSVITSAATNDPFPIGCFNLVPISTLAAQGGGGLTRVPIPYASTSWYWNCTPQNGLFKNLASAEYPAALSQQVGGAANTLNPATNTYIATRATIPMLLQVASQTTETGVMDIRGLYNNLLMSGAAPTSVALGDTVAINGTYWTWIGAAASGVNAYIDTGVAV